MKFRCHISIALLFFISGCAWLKSPEAIEDAPEPTPFVQSGKTLDFQRLKAGGKLLVIPFKAGENVEATEDLNKLALMIVKGIAEVLQAADSPFELLFAENASEADLTVEGHIINIGQSSKVKKIILMDKGKSLAVKGKVVDPAARKTLLVFNSSKEDKDKTKTFADLAEELGRDIGNYILSVTQKN